MWKRLLASILLSLLPQVALAASSDGLGAAATGGSTGSSSADAAALQPAGTSALQATGDGAQNAGLTAPATQALQAPAISDDQLRVFMAGETDGERQTQTPAQDDQTPWWLWLGVGGLLLVSGLAWAGQWWQGRRETAGR